MKDATRGDAAGSDIGLHDHAKPALQVVCLGSSGGPCEENVTAFLVRSVESNWAKGSVLAVDAGSHLAPITRILERDFPAISGAGGVGAAATAAATGGAPVADGPYAPRSVQGAAGEESLSPALDDEEPPKPEPTVLSSGPFAGLKLPNASARANALHVLRSYIATYLITHPHLDHFAGFAINTAAFHATSKPKTLAALPSTVDAIKQHIFNDVIWPNLSDEDGGVGFVTFQRLKEGGDVMVGEGEGRGYIDVVDGLGVRAFKVSHGACINSPPNYHQRGSTAGLSESQMFNMDSAPAMGRSLSAQFSAPGTPGITPRQSFYAPQASSRAPPAADSPCVVDSTAFFIRDTETSREVLIFGDVEPDSLSLAPRTRLVWQEAAHRIAHGLLGGIFIECSYDNSQADALLFGHLSPRHLIAELQTLAAMVIEARATVALEKSARKRKRSGQNGLEGVGVAVAGASEDGAKRSRSLANLASAGRSGANDLRRRSATDDTMVDTAMTSPSVDGMHNGSGGTTSPHSVTFLDSGARSGAAAHAGSPHELPLSGIRIIVIHIKDTLRDGPHVSETILAQLREHELRLRSEGQGLGCEFVASQSGESYWF